MDSLGPAVTGFPLMSSVVVDDVLYVGSRNLHPARIAAIDLVDHRLRSMHELPAGNFVQTLRQAGQSIFAGVTHAADGPNVHRLDLSSGTVEGWATVPDMYVRELCVLPDDRLAVVGRQPRRSSGAEVWLADGSGSVTELCVPDPHATQGTSLTLAGGQLWCGTGANLGGDGSGSGGLFMINSDRGSQRMAEDQLSGSAAVRCLAGDDRVLLAGTEGDPAQLVEVEVATGAIRDWTFAAKVVSQLLVESDHYLITTSEPCRLWQVDRSSGAVRSLGIPLPHGEVWGLHRWQDRIIGTASGGWMFTYADGRMERRLLTDLGVPAAPQLGMSIAAPSGSSGSAVITAGNFTLQRHAIGTRTVTDLSLPGEAKDMAQLGETLYLGVYNSQGIWSLDLTDSEAQPTQCATLRVELNRPQIVVADQPRNSIWVGIQNDWAGTGALVGYQPTDGRTMIVDDPLTGQLVRAVLPTSEGIWIGGECQSDRRQPGRIALVDPETELVGPVLTLPAACGVSSIATWTDGSLLVAGTGGELFSFTPGSPEPWRELQPGNRSTSVRPRLHRHRDRLWMITAAELIMIDEPSAELITHAGLDGEWYSGPRVAFLEDHAYTLAGRELVAVPL